MGLTVCLTTVGNAVNGMMYSYKKMHYEPATMNYLSNKEEPISMFGSRSTGWSRVGRRAVAARCTSKGQNLHIIGVIEQTIGIVYYTIRQGSLKEDFLQWLCRRLSMRVRLKVLLTMNSL